MAESLLSTERLPEPVSPSEHEWHRLFAHACGEIGALAASDSLNRDWSEVFRRIKEAFRGVFPFTGMLPALVAFQPGTTSSSFYYHLHHETEEGFIPDEPDAYYLPNFTLLLDEALIAEKTTAIDDFNEWVGARDAQPLDRLMTGYRARSILRIPLGRLSGDPNQLDPVGILLLYHSEPNQYTDFHLRLGDAIAPFLLSVLRNIHLAREHRSRKLHSRIISEITAEAIGHLPSLDMLYQRVVQLVHDHFNFFDVAIFRVEWSLSKLVLRAHAGDYRHYLSLDYEQDVNTGILGYAARVGETYVANDIRTDPYYINAFPYGMSIRSELAVPIVLRNSVIAVFEIQSPELGSFDRYDVEAMELLCRILARILETSDNFQEMRRLKEFNSQVLDTMPSAVVVLDETHHVIYANEQFCALQNTDMVALLYQPLHAICSPFLMEAEGLRALLEQLTDVDGCGFLSEVRLNENPQSRIVDIRISKTEEEQKRYVLILDDVTSRVHQLEQLRMLQALGHELQRTLDLDSLLHAILTCVTAGPGFGFNRAVIFLLNEAELVLEERFHIGPSSHEEAHRIWSQIPFHQLEEYLQGPPSSSQPIQVKSRYMRVPVTEQDLEDVAKWRFPFVVRRDESHPARLVQVLRNLSEADETLVIPLIARDRLTGLIFADNLFTGQSVADRTLQTLGAFASQAALAVSNAATFRKLEATFAEVKSARSELLKHEKLAIIGQMAAHVAHEIRNPLVSIGGYARRIERSSEDPETKRRIQTVIREVERLEIILKDVMDFASPFSFQPKEVALEDIVREVADVLSETAAEANVYLDVQVPPNLPHVRGDAVRLKQVLINLAKNAIEAMPLGGTVTFRLWADDANVVLEIRDTGKGIRLEDLEHIFDPFFTTKQHGSGLGLAVTHKIIQNHGGEISADSTPNVGTTFTIRLPKYT